MSLEDMFRKNSTSDTILLAVGCTVLLANAIGFLRKIDFRQLCAGARSLLRATVEALRSRKAAEGDDDDEVGLMVNTMMQQTTLDRFRMVCNMLCAVKFGLMGALLFNNATKQAVRVSFVGDFLNLAEHGIFTLVVLCPGVLNSKTIDLFYAAFLFCSALYALPGLVTPGELIWTLGLTNLQVAALHVGRTRGRAVMPLNLFYVIVTSLAIVVNRNALRMPAVLPAMVQLMLALAVLPCLHTLELGMEAAIRQGLEVNATKELLAAVSAVLRSCCDVVVELDSEGAVASPALDLEVFLLRGRGRSLQNTKFTDLLADDGEKSIFLKKLKTPKATDLGVAEALHVYMRDADSSLLQVELFTCPFCHLSGQARNLVGIRESSGTPAVSTQGQRADRPPQRSADAGGADPMPSEDEREPPLPTPEEECELSADSAHSSRSLSSALSRTSDSVLDPWRATLIVDATSDRLGIHGCSPGFQVSVGRLAPGLGLLDIVKEAEDFAKWMKMAATYGADWPKSRVTLNLRQGCLRATVRVAHEEEDGSVDRKHIQLLFSKITKSKVHSDGCSRFKPHTNYRGTPVLHMAL